MHLLWYTIQNALLRLLPLLFWGGIGIYLIYRRNHPVKRSPLEKAVLRIIGGVFLGCLLLGGIILFVSLYRFTARSRVSAANSSAKHVSDAFTSSVIALDTDGLLPQRCEAIYSGRFGTDAPEGTLADYMNWYGNDGDYYVIVTDDNWNIRYTLWSRKPITPDEIHPYTRESQVTFMRTLFRDHSELVGYFSYEENH